METVFEGKDWSEIKYTKSQNDLKGEDTQTDNNEYYRKFFGNKSPFEGNDLPPFNLGIYVDEDENILRASQYVGIVPAMEINQGTNSSENEIQLIKVSSRFSTSTPVEMLKKVLSGNDYYENPDMLKTKIYSVDEWKSLKREKNEVLFGTVRGVGNIELFSRKSGQEDSAGDSANDVAYGLADVFGVFEILDFVNKAKKVCEKNLKKQSQKVEENLNCKVKGRILVQKQIKYNLSKGQNQKVYCSYNKMTDNIRENQIIKYALYLCRKHEMGEALGEDIRFCMNTLTNVPLKKCNISDFIGLKNNGVFRQYKEALAAAKKIIKRYSVSELEDQLEKVAGASEKTVDDTSIAGTSENKVHLTSGEVVPYFIDMNLLFEYYCRAIFKEAIEYFNDSKKSKETEIKFNLERKQKKELLQNHLDIYMKRYEPDIVVTYGDGNTIAAVFDAKYSKLDKQCDKVKRQRTHQIMFYMKILGCDYGGLISPDKKEGEPAGVIKRKLNMSKNNLENIPELFHIPLGANQNLSAFKEYLNFVQTNLNEIAEKIQKQKNKQSACGEFLEWLNENYDESKVKKGKKFTNEYMDVFHEKFYCLFSDFLPQKGDNTEGKKSTEVTEKNV